MLEKKSELIAIYNEGERLVPGETHDRDEVVRHKSSYEFFCRVIERDILNDPSILLNGLTVLDIGSGTGHGTFMLSRIPGVKVLGIEPGVEAIEYARRNYSADNIGYINVSLDEFVNEADKFDYIVSRHALEHVVDGLNKALEIRFCKRLMVNVPFNENDRNPFHLVHWITEENFKLYNNKEFFYESMSGETSLTRSECNPPNSIVCVSSAVGMVKVCDMLTFPFPPWHPEFLQELGLTLLADNLVESKARLIALEAALASREAELASREAELASREAQLLSRISAFDSNKSVKLLRAFKLLR